MKIKDAKQLYAAQRSELWKKSENLTKLLEKQGASPAQSFDRLELSRELSETNAQYNAVDRALSQITAMESAIFGGECTRQQNEVRSKMAEDTAKVMEVYRRIASGAKVPAKDQQKLMDYDFKLYIAAKQAALMAQQSDKEYDSLWEDEEETEAQSTPEEVAGNSEISVPDPSTVAAEAPEPQ